MIRVVISEAYGDGSEMSWEEIADGYIKSAERIRSKIDELRDELHRTRYGGMEDTAYRIVKKIVMLEDEYADCKGTAGEIRRKYCKEGN